MRFQSFYQALFLILIFLAAGRNLFALEEYAVGVQSVVERLDMKDDLFKQYVFNVAEARKLVLNEQKPLKPKEAMDRAGFTLLEYKPLAADDLYTVAARCSIFASSLASLNHIAHPGVLNKDRILLPSIPGLFVPLVIDAQTSDLEKLMAGARIDREGVIITIRRAGKEEQFLFFPGEDFSAVERAFFVKEKDGFFYPLRSFTLTSGFGIRKNPVTGSVNNHAGLDLAAPLGTAVFAAQRGTVTEVGNDAVYGNYIVIKHPDNWASLYGHLSKIETAPQKTVEAGALIGRVGSTGQSTGPHLHFELRKNGKAQDPGKLLFKGK